LIDGLRQSRKTAHEPKNVEPSIRFLWRIANLKVAAISDTHGRKNWSIPACDVFIHAGDITGWGSLEETADFADWLEEQMESQMGPRHAIIVPGNHDECFESAPEKVKKLFGPSVHILQDQPLSLEGVTFYGSPWTPPFMQWHFMADENRLAELYEQIPFEVDVLVTHGPPRGILDPGWNGLPVGSTALAEAVAHRHVKHYVFGHLHGAGGRMIQQAQATYYNVAACDEKYIFRNEPRVFEI
jgi:Icc-related predicted phosphoesterase